MSRRRGDDRLVYSSGSGRVEARKPASPRRPQGDGIARVRREVKGRRGKTVTTISGLALADDALRDLAAELKRSCGSGGAVKDGIIEIQGDHRDTLVAALESRGHRGKLAGG
jgi:translation initiation factor 1